MKTYVYNYRKPRSLTGVINRCNLNSKIGQRHLDFLKQRHFLEEVKDGGLTLLRSTEQAEEYITLFNTTYQHLFDDTPEFRL